MRSPGRKYAYNRRSDLRRGDPRPATLTTKQMRAEYRLRAERGLTVTKVPADRPRTRGECIDGPRPCPWVGCRYHLYLDVREHKRDPLQGIVLVHPHLEPWEMVETCALDVADRGECTLDYVGELLNVTREWIRQIQLIASRRLKRAMRRYR